MNPVEISRAIRAEITAAEAALAKADALATAEFRALVDPADLAKVETAHARATKAVGAMHKALDRASKATGGITPQFGK